MCEDETSSSIDPLLSNNACACAPSYCNESIFFNLILNTEYENTKENCLIFLQNYSKHVILPKRDLFKNIINELTLSQFSKKEINSRSASVSLNIHGRLCSTYAFSQYSTFCVSSIVDSSLICIELALPVNPCVNRSSHPS